MTRKSLRAPASERRQQTIQNKRSWKVTDSRQKPLKLTVAKISKRVCTAQFACFFGSYSVSPVGWHHPPTSGSYVACRGSSPRSDVPACYLRTAPGMESDESGFPCQNSPARSSSGDMHTELGVRLANNGWVDGRGWPAVGTNSSGTHTPNHPSISMCQTG